MPTEFPFNFRWTRHPGAKVKHIRDGVALVEDGRETLLPRVFEISPLSGRHWTADSCAGFWRDFADRDPADEDHVLTFIRRRGLPYAADPAAPTLTTRWYYLRDAFARLAAAWDEPDAKTGMSEITDLAKRDAIGKAFKLDYETDGKAFSNDLRTEIQASGNSYALTSTSLASFMFVSAWIGLQRGMPMRRCIRCGSWFYPPRKDATYCGSSCRSMQTQETMKARRA